MGRMAEITVGAGDHATAPFWAKHPEQDNRNDDTNLFMFNTKIGCEDKEVFVIAKVFDDGQCEEIYAVLGDCGYDITGYLTSDTLDDLCKLAETKFLAEV